ncbi:hypothetical protein RF683_02125 [Flavobacterium sp. 20NA77.7]|uniref:Autotransporter outer membrane beta-barrel domain-containing protein n=1 Tax=Flavobacterium nakdongensis TaxID=3073563 RepID=A0ABY9RAK0_9FLAO|nr:hypothetical protein [Flavobacterium sp. 20NA77.7]WMW78263.1 hypothetical protein RF683_02125 [Flavobacterium sp. 20NA77.7]
MKRIISFLFILSGISIHAQQNYFNVPSSDITEKNKIFIQHQINIASDVIQNNTTFDLGLGNNYEIGLNVIGLNFEKQKITYSFFTSNIAPYSPFLMVNAQKKIALNEKFSLAAGIQQGISISSTKKNGGYYYLNSVFKNEAIGLKITSGIYYATDSFVGEGKRLYSKNGLGIHSGIEKSIIHKKVVFQSDFISGQHSLGELVIGGAYYLKKDLILSGGYQLPTFNSLSNKSLVFELTYNP